jgi:ATP-dependent DNA helicase RecQ
MTRAKKNLTIHLNTDLFDDIKIDNITQEYDDIMYSEPARMTLQLTHEDVWLDWFASKQNEILGMNSGDLLVMRETQCLNEQGRPILEFSQKFKSKIIEMKKKGYMFSSAKVGFIMHWLKLEAEKEILIVLPELVFEKQ